MNCKEWNIVCNGKEIATINCTESGIDIKCTEEGKNILKEFGKGCC